MYNEQPKTVSLPIAISLPMPIKSEQYNLINMRFDPTQNSPPSVWKARLNKRISASSMKKECSKKMVEL
jgi:hypothetical protein